MAARKTTLYLRVDDRELWSLPEGGAPARVSGLATALQTSPQRIRIAGGVSQARLALGVHGLASLQSTHPELELGTPAYLQGMTPPEALRAMAAWTPPPASMGGWHAFDSFDLATLKLAAADDAEIGIGEHFLSEPLSFVTGCDDLAVAALVSLILDPRWFIDPAKPDSYARLFEYLGLGGERAVQPARRHLVNDCWGVPFGLPDGWDVRPECFLWRDWYAGGRGNRGILRASRRFVKYLRSVWLHALYAGRHELFVPECFFHLPAEATAFRSRCASFLQTGGRR